MRRIGTPLVCARNRVPRTRSRNSRSGATHRSRRGTPWSTSWRGRRGSGNTRTRCGIRRATPRSRWRSFRHSHASNERTRPPSSSRLQGSGHRGNSSVPSTRSPRAHASRSAAISMRLGLLFSFVCDMVEPRNAGCNVLRRPIRCVTDLSPFCQGWTTHQIPAAGAACHPPRSTSFYGFHLSSMMERRTGILSPVFIPRRSYTTSPPDPKPISPPARNPPANPPAMNSSVSPRLDVFSESV